MQKKYIPPGKIPEVISEINAQLLREDDPRKCRMLLNDRAILHNRLRAVAPMTWHDDAQSAEVQINREVSNRQINDVYECDNRDEMYINVHECEYLRYIGSGAFLSLNRQYWQDTVECQLQKNNMITRARFMRLPARYIKDSFLLTNTKQFIRYCKDVVDNVFVRDMQKHAITQWKKGSTVKLNHTVHVYYHKHQVFSSRDFSADVCEDDRKKLAEYISCKLPDRYSYECFRYDLGIPRDLHSAARDLLSDIDDNLCELSGSNLLKYSGDDSASIVKHIYSAILSAFCRKRCLIIAVITQDNETPYIYFKSGMPDSLFLR